MARLTGDAGSVATPLPFLLWVLVLAAIALHDVTAYLTAAARAQTLADGAALAAVAAADSQVAIGAVAAANQVVAAGGGALERCGCHRQETAEVTVSVPVRALALTRLGGARRVTATGEARLLPQEDLRRGPVQPAPWRLQPYP